MAEDKLKVNKRPKDDVSDNEEPPKEEEKKELSPDIMEYRMLGKTGLKVSCLGLGSMVFNSEEQAMELMSAVRSYGVNFFDNAEAYGDPVGIAETYFGAALKKLQEKDAKLWRRSDLVITTKLFFGAGGEDVPNKPGRAYGKNEKGVSRKHLMEGIKESLERMQLEYVDVLYAHRMDYQTPMLEIVRGFTDIINSGKALYWGTSMWPPVRVCQAYYVAKLNGLIPPVVEQPVYNMLNRKYVEVEYEPFYAEPFGIGTTVWSPLDGGVLTGKYVNEIPKDARFADGNKWGKWYGGEKYIGNKNEVVKKLMEIAKELGISMVSLALGWVLKNRNVSVCILGGSKSSQLLQNAEALAAAKKIDKGIYDRIEEILDNKPSPDPMYLVSI